MSACPQCVKKLLIAVLAAVSLGCTGVVEGTPTLDAQTADATDDAPPDEFPDVIFRVDSGAASDAMPMADATDASAEDAAEPPADTRPAPDIAPPPPGPLPLPDGRPTVDAVARDHPEWLQGSCVEMGGDNRFLFEVVRRLRATDPRWGLNWKRGVVGDLSQDVIDYHWGSGTREGSTDVYIIDIIVGHCGDSPSTGFLDQTEATAMAGTVGRWTVAPLP